MNALLDTNALLWALLSPPQLSRKASEFISDPTNEIAVSAACAWEISTKVRLGKLLLAEDLERDFVEHLDRAGFLLLDIRVQDALRAGRMPGAHRDPFDRMIAAQAIAWDIPLISADAKLDLFGVRRLW